MFQSLPRNRDVRRFTYSPYMHAPPEHTPPSQPFPHPPQLFESLPITLTHVPLQFVSPEGHVATHCDPLQERFAPVGVVGQVAQAPLQANVPEGQPPHAPPLHNPLLHTVPHPPQFPLSLPITLIHVPLQFVSPEGHVAMHCNPLHEKFAPAGVVGQVSHIPLQANVPEGQLPHDPLLHNPLAQTIPHPPQLPLSLPITLAQTPEQACSGAGQVATQVIPLHE
jgi:hypothetical protein